MVTEVFFGLSLYKNVKTVIFYDITILVQLNNHSTLIFFQQTLVAHTGFNTGLFSCQACIILYTANSFERRGYF